MSIVYGLSVIGTQVRCYTYKTQLRKVRSEGWHELLDARGTRMMMRIHRVVNELGDLLLLYLSFRKVLWERNITEFEARGDARRIAYLLASHMPYEHQCDTPDDARRMSNLLASQTPGGHLCEAPIHARRMVYLLASHMLSQHPSIKSQRHEGSHQC